MRLKSDRWESRDTGRSSKRDGRHTVFFLDGGDAGRLRRWRGKRRRGGGGVLRRGSSCEVVNPPVLDVLFFRHGEVRLTGSRRERSECAGSQSVGTKMRCS
jgi:hypothetical protein